MQEKSLPLLVAALASVFVIAGCSSKPSDSEAKALIEKQESRPNISQVANIVKKNGWPEDENTYVVEYTYDTVAAQDFDAAVFSKIAERDLARAADKSIAPEGWEQRDWDITASSCMGTYYDPFASLNILRQLESTSEGMVLLSAARRINKRELSERQKGYLVDAKDDEVGDKKRTLLFASYSVERLGYKPETKKGDVLIKKEWKISFRKTENGWQLK